MTFLRVFAGRFRPKAVVLVHPYYVLFVCTSLRHTAVIVLHFIV